MSSSLIHAQLNGESRELPAGTTVTALLQSLGLPAERVAVECNRQILKQPHWDSTEIQDGWTLEIVTFVGGG